MQKKYNPHDFEKKIQKFWEDKKCFETNEDPTKRKFFALIEFPYPSGAGLHVGHVRPFTAMDVVARKRRMEGYDVLYPIGFDAFGLPTENFAIKTGRPPEEVTAENIATFTRQMKSLGLSFDWSRKIDTTNPAYYKWTQWIFLQLFKYGLAYKKNQPINWCPKDKIGLANEEVVGGCCERCGTQVEQRNKEQWMLAITKYADKLLEGLKEVDYIAQAKTQQENWIGKSEGAEIEFQIKNHESKIKVFTTRPDTLFGVTYLVVAPEHPLLNDAELTIQNREELERYSKQTKNKSDLERTDLQKEKTGVEIRGVKAIHPVTKEELPVWVADYVLASYGTGAIMAVPAHDERDFEFAHNYGLASKPVVAKYFFETENPPRKGVETVRRKTIHAIVRRKTDGNILMLEWKANQRKDGSFPYTFVIGGVEEGEDMVEAARRELEEEVGIVDAVFVKQLPFAVQTEYFAGHKNQNRYSEITVLYFEVDGDKHREIAEEELQKHTPRWVPEEEVADTINIIDGPYIWQQFLHPTALTEKGIVCNSDFLNDLTSEKAIEKMIDWLEKNNSGKRKVQYKLRDWVFSRQRYWGEPIPLVYCENCAEKKQFQNKGEEINPGWIAYEKLPLELPVVEKYEPTDTGESPLSKLTDWVNTTCPRCGGSAKRETDTMPNWAGSSWYFLRYADPTNEKEFAAQEKLKYWMPVDWYNGGMEHVVLHLLYSRFWNQFLFDVGLVPTREPYKKRTSHGMILAKGGEKMSKSRGNVVNPDEMIEKFGADALRVYIMFMGPFDQAVEWDTNGLVGMRRFLDRVWNLYQNFFEELEKNGDERRSRSNAFLDTKLNKLIEKVSDDIEKMNFNTAVAAMMKFLKFCDGGILNMEHGFSFLKLLYPFAPHISSQLFNQLQLADKNRSGNEPIDFQPWPETDGKNSIDITTTIPVQINGKKREEIVVEGELIEEDIKRKALASEKVQKWLEGKEPKKVIYVKGKIISIVV